MIDPKNQLTGFNLIDAGTLVQATGYTGTPYRISAFSGNIAITCNIGSPIGAGTTTVYVDECGTNTLATGWAAAGTFTAASTGTVFETITLDTRDTKAWIRGRVALAGLQHRRVVSAIGAGTKSRQ